MLIGDVDSDPFISRPPPPTLPIDYSYPSLFLESMSLSLAHPKLNFWSREYYLDECVMSRINNQPVQ